MSIASNGYLLFEDFYKTVGLSNVSGPIEIVALDEIQITAVARVYSTEHTGAYLAGIAPSRASTELFLPYFVNNPDFRTNLGVNNPGAGSATVTITLTDKEGGALGSQMVNVPPNGLAQFNDIIRALIGGSQNTDSRRLDSSEFGSGDFWMDFTDRQYRARSEFRRGSPVRKFEMADSVGCESRNFQIDLGGRESGSCGKSG